MKMLNTIRNVSGPVALAGLLILGMLLAMGVLQPVEAPVARSYTCLVYTEQGCGKLVVASGGEIEVQSGGVLDVQGKLDYGMASITPGNGSTLNPAVGFYEVNSAGAVTITLGTTDVVAGQWVWLYGDDANTVTIADTNIRTHDGNALALGQYDLIGMIFDGTAWIQAVELANQ